MEIETAPLFGSPLIETATLTGIPDSLIKAGKIKLIQILKEQFPDLDLSPDEVILEHFKSVTWPNSAIGCPKPGHYYLQVLTPGYSIGFQVGDAHYKIHTNATGSAIASPDFP